MPGSEWRGEGLINSPGGELERGRVELRITQILQFRSQIGIHDILEAIAPMPKQQALDSFSACVMELQ